MGDLIATILSILLALFKPKVSATQAVVAVANQEAAISAQTASQTAETTQKELANVQAKTDASVAAVHSADGLRIVADEVNDAVDRANATGSN